MAQPKLWEEAKSDSVKVVSFGGGVNSTAMLIGMRERDIIPDLILFADTGCEKPETYKHLGVMRQWCIDNDFPEIVTVSYSESRHHSLEDECLNNETLPSKAFGFSGCSVKWKRQPMDKYIAKWEIACREWYEGRRVDRLIGIHYGEKRRGKIPDCNKYRYVYPLRIWGWDQGDCQAAHARAGIRMPVKSACFFCPAMKPQEVVQLSQEHPELYLRSLEIEDNAKPNLTVVKGLGRTWSWREIVEDPDRKCDNTHFPICDSCYDGE